MLSLLEEIDIHKYWQDCHASLQNIPLDLFQTETYYRDENKGSNGGWSWKMKSSLFGPNRKAAWFITLRQSWSWSSCPLPHCPSWKCLASPPPWLKQWLLPRSTGFLQFHTSCCSMWSPAPLGDGSHGTFSVTRKQKNRKQSAMFISHSSHIFCYKQRSLLFLCSKMQELQMPSIYCLVSVYLLKKKKVVEVNSSKLGSLVLFTTYQD